MRGLPGAAVSERDDRHPAQCDADLRDLRGRRRHVSDSPGVNRVFVTFTDSGGVLRGKTSVAVRTR
jgi:hypothetical protein